MSRMQRLQSRTVRVVALSSLLAVLAVGCVLLPNAVGATEETGEPATACGLDVAVILDDGAAVDDSAAAQSFRAMRALTSALHDTPSNLTVSVASRVSKPSMDPVRPLLVVHVTVSDPEQIDMPPTDVLFVDVRVTRDSNALGATSENVYTGVGTFDLTTHNTYRAADYTPLEDAVRAAASEPCVATTTTTGSHGVPVERTSTTVTTAPVVEPAPAVQALVAEVTSTTTTTVPLVVPPPVATAPPVVMGPPLVAEVHVEQLVNGDDADVAPGPRIFVDDRITWTYAVTNRGNGALHGVILGDSLGLKPQLVGGDNGDGQLAPTEMWTYRAESAAATGPQRSVATVTALDLAGKPVSNDDPTHYSGMMRAVIGDTVWNDRDKNAAPGPNESGVGDARVVITNQATGDQQVVTTDESGDYRAAVEPGDYEVTLDMDSVDGELTTADEFEFSVDEGEWYLDADFGLDEFDFGDPLPVTGSTTTTPLRIGILALAAGALLLVVIRMTHRHAAPGN